MDERGREVGAKRRKHYELREKHKRKMKIRGKKRWEELVGKKWKAWNRKETKGGVHGGGKEEKSGKSVVRGRKMREQWEAETKVQKNNEMEGVERKGRKQTERKCVNLCWQPGSRQKKKPVSNPFFHSFVLPPSFRFTDLFPISPLLCFGPVALFVCVYTFVSACVCVFRGLFIHVCAPVLVVFFHICIFMMFCACTYWIWINRWNHV